MADLDITVPTFVKGESGFAAKLNELAAAVLIVATEVNKLNAALEATKAPAPAKPATRKTATTKAE